MATYFLFFLPSPPQFSNRDENSVNREISDRWFHRKKQHVISTKITKVTARGRFQLVAKKGKKMKKSKKLLLPLPLQF